MKYKQFINFITLLMITIVALSAEEIDLGKIEVIDDQENQYEKDDQPETFTTIIEVDEKDETKNIAEILSASAEVFIKDTGGEAGISTVSIRGSTSKNVLILIDGLPINTAGNSSFDISMIPASSVEKIEIIRGGDASLYGPGAMGGVINIITKKTDRNYFKNTVSSKLNQSFHNIMSSGIYHQHFDLFISLDYLYDQGNYQYFDNNGTEFNEEDDTLQERAHNCVEKNSLLLKQNFYFPQNITAGYSFHYNVKKNEIAGPLTFENHFENAFFNTSLMNIGTTFSLGNSNPYFTGDFFLNYKKDYYQYTNPQEYGGASLESTRTTHFVKHKFHFQILAIPFNLLHVIGEFSYENIEGISQDEDLFIAETIIPSRIEISGIIRDEFLVYHEKIGMIPTARFQYNSDLAKKFHFLWNLGAFFKPAKGLKLKFNGFHAFRNPDFTEMYYSYGQYVGNPDLNPEISYGGDAGIHYKHKYFFVESAFFCTYYQNLIMYLLSYGFVYKPKNVGNVISFGGEFRFHFHMIKFFNIQLSYTLNYVNDWEDLKNGILKQLPAHPLQTLVSSIKLNFPTKIFQYNLGTQFKFEDSILITYNGSKFIPPKIMIDFFWRVTAQDIKILEQNIINFTIFMNINNLLNIYTTDVRNYPLEGFSVEIGSSFQF
ncbi:MAG: TonB-dependent receptor [Spirochaetes bacterium]|nr:TonB-dependent receptor [Spirochaetota bacterium]